MGKIAKALGIGVKGDVTIALEQTAYRPGQTVTGVLRLRVRDAFDGDALTLTVVGEERLKWDTQSTSRQNNTTVTETTHHKQRLELFRAQLSLAPAQAYETGAYAFPFQCVLPLDLPSSFEYSASNLGDMRQLRAAIVHKIKAELPVRGAFRADLGTKRLIHVESASATVARSARATRSQKVETLGMFGKGTCEISARLQRDVLHVGDAAEIRCKIDNRSRKRVKDVAALLYQDVKATPMKGDGPVREYTTTVRETHYPGFGAGESKDVLITPEIVSDSHSVRILPTHLGHLLSIQYRIRVKCEYSLCPSTKIEFPVTIAH